MALTAYPRSVRARFGRDLRDAFRDGHRGARARGPAAAARFTVRAIIDAARNGLSDRMTGRSGMPQGDGPGLVDTVRRDVAFALRSLRRSPGFSAAAVATLALGIGANTAIFSVIDMVIFRPLPFPEPERIVTVWASRPDLGVLRWGVSAWDFGDWDERNRVFEAVAMYLTRDGNLTGGNQAERIRYTLVTSPFLAVMGVAPSTGRDLTAAEDPPGGAAVALVSAGFAVRRFGDSASALGQDLILDDRPHTIVGIMPGGFDFPPGTEIWKPFETPATESGPRASYFVRAIARLRPGITVGQAHADIDGIMQALQEEYPESNAEKAGYVEPLLNTLIGSAGQQLIIVQGIAALVLLIAGVNVSTLLLTRASARGKEMAVRAALGASTRRLTRQLVTESLVLALVGGLLGLWLARLALPAIVRLGATAVPRLAEVSLDTRVLGFSVLVSLLAGVGFGAVPALRVARGNVADMLRSGGRSSIGASGARLRQVFAVIQVALAMVVLVGAALLLRSFANVQRVAPGFDVDRLLSVRVEPPWTASPQGVDEEEYRARLQAERLAADAFFSQLSRRIGSLPGVRSAAVVNVRPFVARNMWNSSFEIDGKPVPLQERPAAFARVTTPGYLETLGLPLQAGRWLEATDEIGTRRVVVLSESAARVGFGDTSPIGARITMEGAENPLAAWYEIVGVVGDVPATNLERPGNPMLYMAFQQARFGHFRDWGMDLLVRTEGDAISVAPAVRQVVHELNPDLPVFGISTLEQASDARLARRRFNISLLTLLAGLALTLTLIGIYGVIAYSVSRRAREVGIRLALGAQRRGVVRLIVAESARLAAVGLGLGLLASLASVGMLDSMLFGVEAHDPRTLMEVAGILGAVAVMAGLLPAWRAARLDPTVALRAE